MQLCSEGHPEICYGAGWCPVCDKIIEIAELKAERDDLKIEIEQLKEEQE
jgi:hypothetical protein